MDAGRQEDPAVPDLRTILRSLTSSHAVHNARGEVREQTRIHAEIDALARRLSPKPRPEERRAP